MRKTLTKISIAAGMLVAIGAAMPASAAPPTGSGWDSTPDVVVGGGSDTTYLVSQRLEALYNNAPGCPVITTSGSNQKGLCDAASTAPVDTKGNYDHDVFVSAFPAGSGAGLNGLLSGGTTYNPAIDYARSSRGPSSGTPAEASELTFWGYARDAIAVTTFGSRSNVSLTKAQLQGIFVSCTITDWSQVGQPAGHIEAWDMNGASGTRATFLSYLGASVLGGCVKQLSTSVAPFENDVKPILSDPATTGTIANNSIWWMSFGAYQTYANLTKGAVADGSGVVTANIATVDGLQPSAGTINNNSYGILRTLFQVTRSAQADCRQSAGTAGACDNAANSVYGSTSGKGGAVRQFTQWLCGSNATAHTVNPVTGLNYRNEITGALSREGFVQVPAAQRTAGYACTVLT